MKAEINNLINKWINKYYKRNTYQVDFPAGIESWVHRCSNKTVLDVWQEVCLCGCLYKCMHLYLHVCMMSALVKINIFILFVHVCVCLGVGVCVCVFNASVRFWQQSQCSSSAWRPSLDPPLRGQVWWNLLSPSLLQHATTIDLETVSQEK